MEENIYSNRYLKNNYTFNDNCHYKEGAKDRLLTTKEGEIVVQPMWRMEILGKYYGVNILEYRDDTNWELLDEMLWSSNSEEEREDCYRHYYRPDKFDDYFEKLAEIATVVGCERAEIKCLIKSLILRYSRLTYFKEFPHEEFSVLYDRLIRSNNITYIRAAQKLSKYHAKRLCEFYHEEAQSKISYILRHQHNSNEEKTPISFDS